MAIEFKRVTWYSQIAAIVLFVAVFFVGFYVGRRYEWRMEHGDTEPVFTTVQ